MGLIVIRPEQEHEGRLERVLEQACYDTPADEVIRSAAVLDEMLAAGCLKEKRILFALTTGSFGVNPGCMDMVRVMRKHPDGLENSVAGIIVDGQEEWYTKALAREVAFAANTSGCWFVGRPLAEGTKSLYNYQVLAGKTGSSLYEAYLKEAGEVIGRVMSFERKCAPRPRLLTIHSCNPATSNTYAAYKLMQNVLSECLAVREISLRDSMVFDCAGCAYEQCMYYSRDAKCYYGGTITEEIFPALEACDALLLLCPNYNDALGAGLTAMINRLTSLFRKRPFFDKALFALVVSGYSGSDIICRQLIDALNMNKSFLLPGHFCFTETAGAAGSILERPDIAERTASFARHIAACITEGQA